MKYLTFVALLVFICSCTSTSDVDQTNAEVINALGVRQYIWTDTTRIDEYYGGNRVVNAQVWYPADMLDSGKGETAPYYFKIEAAYQHLDSWSESDYELVSAIKTISYKNLSISGAHENYPLILFSPSLGGHLSQYTFYAESLAKQGYIVMGINHQYEGEYVIDAEGHTIAANHTFYDSLKALNIPEQITAEQYRVAKGIRQKVLGEDLVFSLNQLMQESFFKDKFDDNRIGAFGHSIGGAAVIYASMMDDRIKAVIDLDGTPPSVALEQGISVPFLFIEDLTDYENHIGYGKLHARRNGFCIQNKGESWRILIGGINHNSFLDLSYHLAENDDDKKKAHDALKNTDAYIQSFFAHYFDQKALSFGVTNTDSLEIFYFGE